MKKKIVYGLKKGEYITSIASSLYYLSQMLKLIQKNARGVPEIVLHGILNGFFDHASGKNMRLSESVLSQEDVENLEQRAELVFNQDVMQSIDNSIKSQLSSLEKVVGKKENDLQNAVLTELLPEECLHVLIAENTLPINPTTLGKLSLDTTGMVLSNTYILAYGIGQMIQLSMEKIERPAYKQYVKKIHQLYSLVAASYTSYTVFNEVKEWIYMLSNIVGISIFETLSNVNLATVSMAYGLQKGLEELMLSYLPEEEKINSIESKVDNLQKDIILNKAQQGVIAGLKETFNALEQDESESLPGKLEDNFKELLNTMIEKVTNEKPQHYEAMCKVLQDLSNDMKLWETWYNKEENPKKSFIEEMLAAKESELKNQEKLYSQHMKNLLDLIFITKREKGKNEPEEKEIYLRNSVKDSFEQIFTQIKKDYSTALHENTKLMLKKKDPQAGFNKLKMGISSEAQTITLDNAKNKAKTVTSDFLKSTGQTKLDHAINTLFGREYKDQYGKENTYGFGYIDKLNIYCKTAKQTAKAEFSRGISNLSRVLLKSCLEPTTIRRD